MRYIHFDQPGAADVLQVKEGDQPKPKTGEVLIRVAAAGVNRPDILQRKGAYPAPPGASPILGLEVAGTIVECGPSTERFRVGDRICALLAGGGYAEFCVAPAIQCLPIPTGITMEDAAGIPEVYFTVWSNLITRGKLVKGDTLLIHGGSSGIGTAAIQLARIWGAKVFVTAGSQEKCAACLTLGADAAINYRSQDFVDEIKSLTSQKGVDLILDMVGGDYFQKNLELLSPGGRIVQIAVQKGELVSLSLRTLMSKGAIVTGSTLRPQTIEYKGAIAAEVRTKVWPLFESRLISVIRDQTFPFEKAADAHRRMESGQHIGKIILKF